MLVALSYVLFLTSVFISSQLEAAAVCVVPPTFSNLIVSTGADIRYHSDYFADGYSPVLGQFFYQSERKISIRPDVAAYVNFRIRSFTTYVRIENLNTASQRFGFGFKDNNLAAALYPNPGMVFRLGIFWNFVN
mgnify:CR=1 FL=1